MKKILTIFAALTLSVGLWAQNVGDFFTDQTSGLYCKITAVGETNTVMVIDLNSESTTCTVPATIKYNDVDFAVTEIYSNAFNGCTSLTSISILANVTTIGVGTFGDCTNLQSVTLPESVTTIGTNAFERCSNLKSITIPANVTTIGGYAFADCTILQAITIPASVTEIGERAFSNCTSLQSVTFLGNACQDAIGDYAFNEVGKNRSALLQLPANWMGSKPDKYGRWYGGKFQLQVSPTALPTLFGEGVKGNKFMHKGQLIIRKNGKTFNAVGAEL